MANKRFRGLKYAIRSDGAYLISIYSKDNSLLVSLTVLGKTIKVLAGDVIT